VEDLKDLTGKPVGFMEGLKMNLGTDYYWWFTPTLPNIVPNYLEKAFEIKKLEN